MGFLRSFAAIGWTSTGDTAPTRVHLLGVPLRMTRPALSQATYRAQSLDRTVIESLVIPSGAHELVGDIRYDQDSQGLLDMLAAGSANKTLTYYPDVRDPTQSYTCQLISPVGPEIETLNDPQRATFGDTTVQIRLRRTDQSAFTEQYVGSNILFWYRGGGSLQGFTVTRATATTQIGPGRGTYATVASGKAATSWFDSDADGLRETPALHLSPARTNLCLQSENFGTTWSAINTPTRTAGAKSCGTLSLDLIGDDSAALLEGYSQTISFTGNAAKAISLHVAQDTSTSTVIRLLDSTATANRLLATLTWSAAGVPVLTVATGTHLGTHALENGVYRLLFQTTSVTATNTNGIFLYPATTAAIGATETGRVYAGGVQAEDALYPGPYIPTTTGTVARNADVVSAVFPARPQAMTLYARFVELGTVYSGINSPILSIGASANPRLFLAFSVTAYRIAHYNAAGSVVASAAGVNPAIGDTVELVGVLNADGSVRLTYSINGAAAATSSASAAQALPVTAWGNPIVYLGSEAGLVGADTGIEHLVIVRGVQTIETMRRLARVTQS